MTEREALDVANSYIHEYKKIECAPESIRRIRWKGQKDVWIVMYPALVNFPELIDAVIDDGKCIVIVDNQTGEPSEYGTP